MSSSNLFAIFREAVRVVDRNLSALLLYWAIVIPVALFDIWIDSGETSAEPLLNSWNAVARFFAFVILDAVVNALGATLAFSRIGRNTDKPVWRVEGDWAALQQFFPMWFLLFLATGLFSLMTAIIAEAAGEGSVVVSLFFLYIAFAASVVPVGACLMFSYRARGRGLGEMLQPVANQLGGVAFFVGFGMLAYVFLYGLLFSVPSNLAYAKVIVHVAAVYCDCLVFTGAWLLYKMDRENPQRADDFPF